MVSRKAVSKPGKYFFLSNINLNLGMHQFVHDFCFYVLLSYEFALLIL